jgi:glutathione peroxidase
VEHVSTASVESFGAFGIIPPILDGKRGRIIYKIMLTALLIWALPISAQEAEVTSIYDINVTTIDGDTIALSAYLDKVILIVNVASKCGFTDQYDGLEKLYQEYSDRSFIVLGFPCNQFGSQEPGTEKEIKSFCRLTYGVTFPMFAKIEVNGTKAHPLYVHLKKEGRGALGSGSIKWNFTKFLIDRDGHVVKRFAPSTEPLSLANHIELLLNSS